MRYVLTLLLAIAASGCAAQSQAVHPTYDYIGAIKRHIADNFYDPGSIQDAAVSELRVGEFKPSLIGTYSQVACLRARAKNLRGSYTGMQMSAYYFSGGKIVHVVGPTFYPCDTMRRWQKL